MVVIVLPVPLDLVHAVIDAATDEYFGRAVALDGGFALSSDNVCGSRWFTSDFGCDSGFLGVAFDGCSDGMDGGNGFG